MNEWGSKRRFLTRVLYGGLDEAGAGACLLSFPSLVSSFRRCILHEGKNIIRSCIAEKKTWKTAGEQTMVTAMKREKDVRSVGQVSQLTASAS
jgi:hypothetical protein